MYTYFLNVAYIIEYIDGKVKTTCWDMRLPHPCIEDFGGKLLISGGELKGNFEVFANSSETEP